MAPGPRNNKGTNVPPAVSEPVGENEVASRKYLWWSMGLSQDRGVRCKS